MRDATTSPMRKVAGKRVAAREGFCRRQCEETRASWRIKKRRARNSSLSSDLWTAMDLCRRRVVFRLGFDEEKEEVEEDEEPLDEEEERVCDGDGCV